MKCERCGARTASFIMSKFNTEHICQACSDKEREHPLYKKAVEAELRAVKAGNYNFPGIGKPDDL